MSVLVTVSRGRTRLDVELDDALPVSELLPDLAGALGAGPGAVLTSAQGIALDAGTTLEAAGVLDGDRLTLVEATAAPSDQSPPDERQAMPARREVLPCYLAVDTSDSVVGPRLDRVTVELARLVDALHDEPRLSGSCRLSILTFDEEARVVLPLTPVADLDDAPHLAATRPATDYERLFRLLRRRIDRDLEGLRMAGLRPLRPVVVVVTDGHPTRGFWPPAHAALTDPGWQGSADLLAFGFGEASELTVRRIGTAGAYLPVAARADGPAPLVPPVMAHVLEALGHRPAAVLPDQKPAGWRSLREVIK